MAHLRVPLPHHVFMAFVSNRPGLQRASPAPARSRPCCPETMGGELGFLLEGGPPEGRAGDRPSTPGRRPQCHGAGRGHGARCKEMGVVSVDGEGTPCLWTGRGRRMPCLRTEMMRCPRMGRETRCLRTGTGHQVSGRGWHGGSLDREGGRGTTQYPRTEEGLPCLWTGMRTKPSRTGEGTLWLRTKEGTRGLKMGRGRGV